MIPATHPPLDPRGAEGVMADLAARRPGYVPQWRPAGGADEALERIAARYLAAVIERLNRVPDKNQLAFMDLLGIELVPAQAAAAPVVFQLTGGAADGSVPAGTRLAAPPPPGGTDQVLFETKEAAGVAAAPLREVVTLWPGRDQFIDHSPAFLAGQPLRLFRRADLQETPHVLYLAHDTLLALAGKSTVEVQVELTQPSAEPLDLLWEYWDGQVWRGFRAMRPACEEDDEQKADGTAGLTRSGRFRLETDCAETAKTAVAGISAFLVRGRLAEPLPPDPRKALPEVESVRLVTVVEQPLEVGENDAATGGFLPDKAFADATEVDLTKPFYPFGQQPQPGAAFYFSAANALSRPGAELTVHFQRTKTPQDELAVEPPTGPNLVTADGDDNELDHELAWEYWDGSRWAELLHYPDPVDKTLPSDLDGTGTIRLTVPDDLVPTKVNDADGHWLRVRLLSGAFGFRQTVKWPDEDGPNTFTYVVAQPPALSDFRVGYTWRYGPFHPERTLTFNDFRYEDRTDEAIWPGRTFQPFKPVGDVTPALYLGFDGRLPVDRVGLYLEVVEQPGDSLGPALVWSYWDGLSWQEIQVQDGTRHLRVPGIISLIGPDDSQSLDRFGTARHWLRASLKEDGPPGEPELRGLFANAVAAVQRTTVTDETLGTHDGRAGQVLTFRQIPVLAGERVEVRELTGARANVEWRILATELFGGDAGRVRQLEALLAADGPQLEVELGDLRLRRDRDKRVTEVWVRWQSRRNLLLSGPQDRDYAVDRATGRLRFGDGVNGKLPPLGATVLARLYQAGGGLTGNVAAGTITQLLSGIAGVAAVFNPRPAEGGADTETPEALLVRGPRSLRHRGRALAPQDYETLASEASPAVALARAIAGRDPGGRRTPGWVTLLVAPRSDEPRPWPSFGLREQVRRFIEARAPADLAAAGHLYVTGPDYLAVGVEASLAPVEASEAGTVEHRARAALEAFLHPIRGGPLGRGWELGRDVYLSDVAAVLERVEGVDYVQELALLLGGAVQGERVPVPEERLVVAGGIVLKLLEAERLVS